MQVASKNSALDKFVANSANIGVKIFGAAANACRLLVVYITKKYGKNMAAYIFQFAGVSIYFFASLNMKTNNNIDVLVSFIYRGPVVIIANYLVSKTQQIPVAITGKKFFYLNIRGFIIAIGDLVFFGCFKKLSQPVVYIINTTTPLFIFILNFFVFHTKITVKEFFLIIISFLGVIFVIAPQQIMSLLGMSYNTNDQTPTTNNSQQSNLETIIWAVVLLLSRISNSYAMLMNKIVDINTIEISYYLGWYMIFSGVLCIFQFNYVYNHTTYADLVQCFIRQGIYTYIGQLLLISSYTITTKHGHVALFWYVAVVYSYIYDYYYGYKGLDPISITGTLLLIIGLSNILLSKG